MSDDNKINHKHNDIHSYFEAKLTDFFPDKAIPFNIHLFFKQNEHIIIFRKKGDILTQPFLSRYTSRGINKIWIHEQDRKAYQDYLKSAEQPEQELPLEQQIQKPASLAEQKKEYSEKMLQLIRPSESQSGTPNPLEDKRKTALLAKNARLILQDAVEPHDVKTQNEANLAARGIVKDILNTIETKTKSILAELWEAAEVNVELTHATNVATYAVLLTFALGKADPDLIADLALAGLLHDVGLSQVSTKITSQPWKSYTPEMLTAYSKHLHAGLEIIDAFGSNIPDRVKSLILQHHEKFDGSGYPQKLQGFGIEVPAQLLALAEFLDSMASGQWDGVKRTYNESLTALDELEKSRSFPEHFNPEILSAVLKWTNHPSSVDTDRVVHQIDAQAKSLLQKKA